MLRLMGILVFKAACLIKKRDKPDFLRGRDEISHTSSVHVNGHVHVTQSRQTKMITKSIIIRIKEPKCRNSIILTKAFQPELRELNP